MPYALGMPVTLETNMESGWPMSPREQKRLSTILALVEAIPDTDSRIVWGHQIAFSARRKTFAYYLDNYHDDGLIALWCKSTLTRQRALVAADPETFRVPPYLGPSGWVSVRLDRRSIEWPVIKELLPAGAAAVTAPRRRK